MIAKQAPIANVSFNSLAMRSSPQAGFPVISRFVFRRSEPNSALDLIKAVQGRSCACHFAEGRIERVDVGRGELRTVQKIERVHADFKGRPFLDSKIAPEVGIPLVQTVGSHAGDIDGKHARHVPLEDVG